MMSAVPAAPRAPDVPVRLIHPLWVRVSHWLNALAAITMVVSGTGAAVAVSATLPATTPVARSTTPAIRAAQRLVVRQRSILIVRGRTQTDACTCASTCAGRTQPMSSLS